jgi:ribonucleoside-diphosphate reductase alpha chain
VDKFSYTRFDPSGYCKGETPIHHAKSLVDYVFRWLELNFLHDEEAEATRNRLARENDSGPI